MVRAYLVSAFVRRGIAAGLVCALLFASANASAQTSQAALNGQHIVDVQIVGNRSISLPEIRGELKTRVGQRFDSLSIHADVRALTNTRKIFDVKVKTLPGPQPGTVVVIFQVFEFPKVEYIHFLGNGIREKSLRDAIALKKGDPLDVVSVETARDAVVDFYKERGYNKVQVEIREGARKGDRGVVFAISDGPQQKVWSVDFVGNTIASDARLKTQIQSKPSWIKYTPLGKGYVDLKKIEADIEKLESYYRDLGFMLARVGRELKYNEDESRLAITFVIDEGPRFRVRNVAIRGTQVFGEQQLPSLVELKTGQYYDGPSMRKDVAKLTEIYGAVGYVMVDVAPSPRTLQHTPEIDLVYDIDEGKRYRVGRVNVNIGGDNPHTKLFVALNRISLRPGDIVDIRKIQDSERRLQASGLFAVDPLRGVKPKIVYNPRDAEKASGIAKKRESTVRGQSPDGQPRPLIEFDIVPAEPLPPYWQTPSGVRHPAPSRYSSHPHYHDLFYSKQSPQPNQTWRSH